MASSFRGAQRERKRRTGLSLTAIRSRPHESPFVFASSCWLPQIKGCSGFVFFTFFLILLWMWMDLIFWSIDTEIIPRYWCGSPWCNNCSSHPWAAELVVNLSHSTKKKHNKYYVFEPFPKKIHQLKKTIQLTVNEWWSYLGFMKRNHLKLFYICPNNKSTWDKNSEIQ